MCRQRLNRPVLYKLRNYFGMIKKGGVFEVLQLYSNEPIGGNRIRTFHSLVLQPRLHRKGKSKAPPSVVRKLGNRRTSLRLRLQPRYLTTVQNY
ncbi:hypothetical protein AVEN_210456-1 [Araneus ventricosus]|uniref:Uncharacterized protein n=1 Tax=Araneus ventricosus TaxID=182803 RepID=A0A4Y2HT42_ARAVE|nr:hypothetical protein AVEN_210456-1 [Araneus ventricosus]